MKRPLWLLGEAALPRLEGEAEELLAADETGEVSEGSREELATTAAAAAAAATAATE